MSWVAHRVYFLRESQRCDIQTGSSVFKINSERKKILEGSVLFEKGHSGTGLFCAVVMKLPILRSGSIFHQHVWRMVGRVSYWVGCRGWMVVRTCARVFESLFLGFFHVKVMPSVYCQRPGSTFVQMVPSCIWEIPIAPEPNSLPLPSSLISSPSSFPPPSYLSFRPNLLLFLSLFLSCLAASHLEHHSFLLSPLVLPSPLLCVPCLSCLLSFSTFTSFLFSVFHLPFFSICSRVSERQKGYEKKPDRCWRGELTQPLIVTPWSFCSAQLPPETLVIQI